jgi:hypothetical protein
LSAKTILHQACIVDMSLSNGVRAASASSLASLAADAVVLKKGLMLKQGAVVKSWKERYFVLYKDRLVYFDPSDVPVQIAATPPAVGSGSSPVAQSAASSTLPAASKAKGTLLLSEIRGVAPLSSRGAFKITMSSDREYLLVCGEGRGEGEGRGGEVERNGWIEAIQKAVLTPSFTAQLMALNSELQRAGKMCKREAERVRAWLVSGEEKKAEDALKAAKLRNKEDMGDDEMENLLVDFTFADNESELLRILQDLKRVVYARDTTTSFRDRFVGAAMNQYASSTEAYAAAVKGRDESDLVSVYGGVRHQVSQSLSYKPFYSYDNTVFLYK